MNFFQQLAATGNADLTLRIMQKGDNLTINVMPGSTSSTTQPIIITGTAVEMDEEFFKTILPEVQEVKGIISNIDSVKKEATKSLEDSKSAKKSATTKKEDKPAAKSKKEKKSKNPVVVEADMFGQEPAKDENTGTEDKHDEVVSDTIEE